MDNGTRMATVSPQGTPDKPLPSRSEPQTPAGFADSPLPRRDTTSSGYWSQGHIQTSGIDSGGTQTAWGVPATLLCEAPVIAIHDAAGDPLGGPSQPGVHLSPTASGPVTVRLAVTVAQAELLAGAPKGAAGQMDIFNFLARSCWQSVSYRQDSKGVPLQRQFAAMRVQPATADMRGPEQWLLLERPLQPEGQDLKQYLISLPAETSLAELAEVAHLRAHIERESYQNAKQGVGLTDYQGRSWSGYHRHLAMAWLALTWLQRQRQPLAPPDPPPTPSSTPIAKPTAPTPDRASCPPVVQFGAEKIPLRFAELMADSPRPLPRTRRESLQAVHRRVSQWCRIAVVHEWMLLGRCLLGRCPALPLLQPALAP